MLPVLQLHLDKVLETVQGALQALPSSDDLEVSSKLLVPTETVPGSAEDSATQPDDELTSLDALMCELMDAT